MGQADTRGTGVLLCNMSDIPEETGLRFTFQDHVPIALWRNGDEVFATDDTCTHGQASLSKDGFLEGYTIECGMHQGCFDIRNGQPTMAPCTVPLKIYRVEVVDGGVFVDLQPLSRSVESASS